MAGKNFKCVKPRKELGKLPLAEKPNDEVAIDFAGPFQNAPNGKQYLLVSVDLLSGWPEVLFQSQLGVRFWRIKSPKWISKKDYN